MANGMGSLYIGNSGLRSSQDAINAVANNLANVNTNGYVRQQVVFRDKEYEFLGYLPNLQKNISGLGTSIGSLTHARDVFLDKAYRKDNGRQAYYSASFEAVDEINSFFQELEGTAFQQILTGETSLWQAFQEFAKDPSDTVNQNLVIQKASLFTVRSKAVIQGLVDYQNSVNQQISDCIDEINDYAKQIYDLNVRIQAIESGGKEVAMNERDARDYVIDKLSYYGNISCDEAFDGSVSVKFEGEVLADNMYYYEVGKLRDYNNGYIMPYWKRLSKPESGRYEMVFDFSREISSIYDTDIGQLKALVQARGTKVSNFNDIQNVDPDLYDKTTGLSVMQNTQAEFDQLVHGIMTKINDMLAPNKTIDELRVRNGDGTYSIYQNVQVLDEERCCVGADRKKPPQELFSRSGCERYQEVQGWNAETGKYDKTYYIYNVEDINDTVAYSVGKNTYRVFDTANGTMKATFDEATGEMLEGYRPYVPWDKEGNEKYTRKMINGTAVYMLNEDYSYDTSKQYTASETVVNHNLKEQVTSLPHIREDEDNGDIAYDLARDLAELWDERTMKISDRYTAVYNFDEYYREIVSSLGVIGSAYETTSQNLEAAVEAIDHQRSGVIGVSSDEELTRMIKYQNAYNASSRYIQTVSDMIEMLVTALVGS